MEVTKSQVKSQCTQESNSKSSNLPQRLSLFLEGKLPKDSDIAMVAYADDKTELVKSLNVPIFKCSGICSSRFAVKSRDLIQCKSPSRAKLLLRRTNRWFKLPLTTEDDPIEGDFEDPETQLILDTYLQELQDEQKRREDTTAAIRKNIVQKQHVTPLQETETTETTEYVVTLETEEEHAVVAPAPVPSPEPASLGEEQNDLTKHFVKTEDLTEEQIREQEEFERQLVEMMSGNNSRIDAREAIDVIRPGACAKQQWYVLYHIECSAGGAVAILSGFENENEADEYCLNKYHAFPIVNVTYGPVGQFMPMPPTDYSSHRHHNNPEIEEMFNRIKNQKPY